MKKLLLFSAILLGSVGLVSAQSDRRTKSAKATTTKPVAKTEAEKKAHTADILKKKKADQASKTTVVATKAF